jgi:hypothetical protein
MRIDIAYATAHKLVLFDKKKSFIWSGDGSSGQIGQQFQNFAAVAHIPAGKFACNERVAQYFDPVQQVAQLLIVIP